MLCPAASGNGVGVETCTIVPGLSANVSGDPNMTGNKLVLDAHCLADCKGLWSKRKSAGLSTTAGGRFSKRRPATNSPSWTASGREAVDIAVSTVQHLARAEHLSDVEPLRAESLAPSWGEGVAPAARSAGGTGSALPRGRRGTTRG